MGNLPHPLQEIGFLLWLLNFIFLKPSHYRSKALIGFVFPNLLNFLQKEYISDVNNISTRTPECILKRKECA